MIVYTYSGGGAWPCMVYKGEGGMALCTVQVVVGVWHCVVYSGEGGMALWGGVGGGGCHCVVYKGVWLVCWFLLGSLLPL